MYKTLLLPCKADGCLNTVPVVVPLMEARQHIRAWLYSEVAYECAHHRQSEPAGAV